MRDAYAYLDPELSEPEPHGTCFLVFDPGRIPPGRYWVPVQVDDRGEIHLAPRAEWRQAGQVGADTPAIVRHDAT